MSVSSIPAPQTPRPKPRFNSQRRASVIDTYESFGKEGFAHILQITETCPQIMPEFPYEQEKKFLSKVDLSKGPIIVKVRKHG